jgi:hypothetical protein
MGIGDSLRVDPERLSHHGNQLVDAATGLPPAPTRFVESGTDPLSEAIRDKLPGIEDPIQEALPKLKAEATKTANNIVTAAGQYQRTDEELASKYDAHRFDGRVGSGAGSAGSGGAGGGDAMSSMGQLIGMPMQMASQAAQLPSKALGALASAPQSVMQGVQQLGQMAGGASGAGKSEPGLELPQDGRDQKDGQDHKDEKDRGEKDPQQDSDQQGAAAGDPSGERAPVGQLSTETAVPQQNSGRHAAPDPSIIL